MFCGINWYYYELLFTLVITWHGKLIFGLYSNSVSMYWPIMFLKIYFLTLNLFIYMITCCYHIAIFLLAIPPNVNVYIDSIVPIRMWWTKWEIPKHSTSCDIIGCWIEYLWLKIDVIITIRTRSSQMSGRTKMSGIVLLTSLIILRHILSQLFISNRRFLKWMSFNIVERHSFKNVIRLDYEFMLNSHRNLCVLYYILENKS